MIVLDFYKPSQSVGVLLSMTSDMQDAYWQTLGYLPGLPSGKSWCLGKLLSHGLQVQDIAHISVNSTSSMFVYGPKC